MLSLKLPAFLKARERAPAPPAEHDQPLVLVVCALLLFGLVMVYSASVALPDSPRFANYKPWHFLLRHTISLALGGLLATFIFAIPMSRWQKWAGPLFLGGLVLMVLVLIPGVGKSVYGARRWISLWFLNVQPSELMKLFVALYAADFAVRRQEALRSLMKGFLPMGFAVGAVAVLLMLQPDLGALLVIGAIAAAVLFLGGANGRIFAVLVGVASAVVVAIIAFSPWRRQRFFAYLDPFNPEHALDKGYQLTHSLIAFGRGEWLGVGLGGSVEKLHYLPEAHTDFLLAVVGEELGLVGVLIVICLFWWVVKRCFEIGRAAIRIERNFAGLAAKGIGAWIGVQGFINMGVNLGLLPTKGLTLPFLSYGGSGILVNCAAMAIVLRIDWENRRMRRGEVAPAHRPHGGRDASAAARRAVQERA